MIFASLQVLMRHAFGECIIDDGLHGSVTGVFCILSQPIFYFSSCDTFRLPREVYEKFRCVIFLFCQSVGNDFGNLHGELSSQIVVPSGLGEAAKGENNPQGDDETFRKLLHI